MARIPASSAGACRGRPPGRSFSSWQAALDHLASGKPPRSHRAQPGHIMMNPASRELNETNRRGAFQRRATALLWRGGPVNGELIQRIAERVHRRLNEVVADNPCRLSLGGTYKRAGNLRDMISFIEGDNLGLGI